MNRVNCSCQLFKASKVITSIRYSTWKLPMNEMWSVDHLHDFRHHLLPLRQSINRSFFPFIDEHLRAAFDVSSTTRQQQNDEAACLELISSMINEFPITWQPLFICGRIFVQVFPFQNLLDCLNHRVRGTKQFVNVNCCTASFLIHEQFPYKSRTWRSLKKEKKRKKIAFMFTVCGDRLIL